MHIIKLSQKNVFILAALGSISFVFIGWIISSQQGFTSRIATHQQEIINFMHNFGTELEDHYQKRTCFLDPDQDASEYQNCVYNPHGNTKTVFIWGDSHAAHLFPGFKKYWSDTHRIIHLTSSACPPIVDYTVADRAKCRANNDYIIERIKKEKPDIVILSAIWSKYNWKAIEPTIKILKDAGVQRIDLLGKSPTWRINFSEIMASMDMDIPSLPLYTNAGLAPNQTQLDTEMRKFAAKLDVNYVSTLSIFCKDNLCLTRTGDNPEDLLYWDLGHLYVKGSEFLVSNLKK